MGGTLFVGVFGISTFVFLGIATYVTSWGLVHGLIGLMKDVIS